MKKIILILISFLIIDAAFGSIKLPVDRINVDLFTVDNGLAQSTVTCIIQDSKGFLWIGTQDGLTRYDGYDFLNYRNNPLDTKSLAYNYINTICEDSNGDLWVGTDRGLSKLVRNSGKFVNFFNNPNDTNSLSDNRIYNVYCDKSGIIWIKTLESLDRYVPATNSFIRFSHFSSLSTFSTESIDFAVLEDSQNKLWIGTKDGLCYFDKEQKRFKRFSFSSSDSKSISNNKIKDIIEDSNGNLWVATEYGLNLFNRSDESFKKFYHTQGNSYFLPSNIVNDLYEDHNGTIWIGTDVGFCCFNPKGNTFYNFNSILFHGKELQTLFITSIIEDESHIMWIGSYQGLIKYDTKGNKFKLYSKTESGNNLFSNNFISSLYKHTNGDVWVGTWGSGLHIFNPKDGKNIKYSTSSTTKKIVNDNVHVIFKNKENQIMIGTRDGIQIFNESTSSFVDYFSVKGINSRGLFNNNRVYSIIEDKRGNLWIATRLGLYKVSQFNIKTYQYSPSDTSSISSNECYEVIEDSEGLIWIGTFNGLNCLNPATGAITKYFRPDKYTGKELISNEVICLHEDSDGYIWVGTSSGLHKFDKRTHEFKLFTVQNGLPNNLIYSIEEDRLGNLWISTNWGIASLNLSNNSIKVYDTSDGLQSHEFNINSSYVAKDGEILFGGINGFNSFYPDSLNTNLTVPKIAITDFEVLTKKGKSKIIVDNGDIITLPTDFNAITIQFSTLDFTRSSKNLYAYRIDGLNANWVELGNKREITFSNLKSGTYKLRIKGANSDGIWNEDGISLELKVKTIFWKSKYAFILYSIMFLFGIFMFVRSVTRKYRETSILLREREIVLSEMEEHREELLLKNKNITDSINYAKRIQEAIMPSVDHFKKLLPDSFIFYQPKDIVSGDFYWVNETKNKIFVAVIDCTGHGVPGAFMSIIGVELLRNITNVQGINDAAEILNRLNFGINETFSKGIIDSSVKVKDGMDVAFCVIDKENNILQYAGAFSDLYLIRDSKVTEIKGDRYSVGMGNDSRQQFFSSHYVPIHPDDMIYIFTDGYVDQFGGPDGKKYKFRRFRHLLLNIHKFPMEIQRQYLEDSIKEWKGDHDQVDDILIIGIKPDLSCLF